MKKCKYCGGQMDDYQTRCNDCGKLQPKDIRKCQLEDNSLDDSQYEIIMPRPPFVTGWLWFIIIVGTIVSLIELFPIFFGGSDYPEDKIWISRFSIVFQILIVIGAIMLLMRIKKGFYLMFFCALVGAIMNMIMGEIPIGLGGLVILYFVLQIKSNNIPYWDTLR